MEERRGEGRGQIDILLALKLIKGDYLRRYQVQREKRFGTALPYLFLCVPIKWMCVLRLLLPPQAILPVILILSI